MQCFSKFDSFKNIIIYVVLYVVVSHKSEARLALAARETRDACKFDIRNTLFFDKKL